MWTNTSEELVFQGSAGDMTAKAYIAKWDRKNEKASEVMTEDAGWRKSYYTFRVELTVGSYVFHNYGVVEPNETMYFAHKGNVIEEIRSVMSNLRVREDK